MRRTLAALAALLATLAALAGPACAKSYYISHVDIDVTVHTDGSFDFRETRTFSFDGDFTFAYYRVEKARTDGGTRVEISDFTVGEGGRSYSLREARDIDQDRPPGTYWVSYDYEGRYVYGKWFYRANDEDRPFDISYKVHDAVTVYDDFAQLYWKFVGSDWEVPTRLVTGTIHLPPGADKDRVRAWLHTTLTSRYDIVDERTITFRADNLASRQFVELRILFPPDLVPEAGTRVSGAIWDTAFAEESRWVDDANRRRLEARAGLEARARARRAAGKMAVALTAVALAAWAWLFARFGREHRVTFECDYFR
jgi:hypothetical protein